MNYALLDSDGYIVSMGSGDSVPDGCVEITEPLPDSPGAFHRFNFNQQQWVPMPDSQKSFFLAYQARIQKNQILASTDWTQVADSPLTSEQRAQWAAYRQQVRDITQQPDFPLNIVWPNVPV